MFTGGEDCSARIWDLKMRNLSCQRIFKANAPVTCVCLHPNQQVCEGLIVSSDSLLQEMVVGDQSGVIHIWNLQVTLLCPPTTASVHLISHFNVHIISTSTTVGCVQNDQSEPIIPDPKASIQHICIDPQVRKMGITVWRILQTGSSLGKNGRKTGTFSA